MACDRTGVVAAGPVVIRPATVVGGGVAVTAVVSALALAGAPWWAIALVAVVLASVSAGVNVVQSLIPQDSKDRLDWWRDRRRVSGSLADRDR